MATLHVKYGDEFYQIAAYKQGDNWYNAVTHELIKKELIFWVN